MFVGRKKELNILSNELNKDKSSILLYGKRKIGKTTLVKEACALHKDKVFIYFECLKDSEERNVLEIIKILRNFGLISEYFALPNNSFLDLFHFLNSLDKKFIIAIDEYPYLKEFSSSKTIDSIFQNIIDNYLANINLIILGSHIGMMKDLLDEKNALFGRFNIVISLKELSYLEASEFYPNLKSYDKIAFYSIFGGSPFVNEKLSFDEELKSNIINLLLNEDNAIYNYLSSLLISDLSNQVHAGRILEALGNGRKFYSELEEILDKKKSGLLSKQLKPLLDMGIIKKDAPINKLNDAKKAKYEINDNLLRFYYSFILPNKNQLFYKDKELFYEEDILPSLTTFISYRFEDISKDFIWNYINLNKIKNIKNVGRYYYDDPLNKKNGEFALAILYKDDSVDLIEVKFLKSKVNQVLVNSEIKQIREISGIKVNKIGFVSVNGFENIIGIDYLFDGDDLYKIGM